MATEFQPPESATAHLRKTVETAGYFIHNFATVELLVACWLLALGATRAKARRLLKKEQHLADRVKRLRKLAVRDKALAASGLVEALDQIEPLRRFRNQLAHGAVSLDQRNRAMLVGFKNTTPISPQIITSHLRQTRPIMETLSVQHVAHFGINPTIRDAAEAAPPPID